jgi:hypothetical protein
MIEKLTWHDAEKKKPTDASTVLLWMRSPRAFATPAWDIGWWDGDFWMLCESGGKCAHIVTHWAEPQGPR